MSLLTTEQKLAIDHLAKSSLAKTFYWTGGTLLAYHYLNHRKSLDLDFFSDQSFSFTQVYPWIQQLKNKSAFDSLRYQKIYDRWEFYFEKKKSRTLRLEFVHYNGEKKSIKPRKKLLGVSIDSLEDIAANKVLAYFDRNEPKDLFDIFFLLTKAKFTPAKLMKLANQKFGVDFLESSFWSEAFKSLSALHQLKPLLFGDKESQQKKLQEIENYFKDQSRRFLQKTIT